VGYINHPSRFHLFPWSVEAVRAINGAGWLAVVVTNQAGVARGFFPESMVHHIHDSLSASMLAGGARLDAIYYCPHHPAVGVAPYRLDCDCRKPRPGMLQRAQHELGADLARSWVIGDRRGDLQLAWGVGCKAALIKSGYGRGEVELGVPHWDRAPDLIAEHVLDAVGRILESEA